jgi:hypothetical protein
VGRIGLTVQRVEMCNLLVRGFKHVGVDNVIKNTYVAYSDGPWGKCHELRENLEIMLHRSDRSMGSGPCRTDPTPLD